MGWSASGGGAWEDSIHANQHPGHLSIRQSFHHSNHRCSLQIGSVTSRRDRQCSGKPILG